MRWLAMPACLASMAIHAAVIAAAYVFVSSEPRTRTAVVGEPIAIEIVDEQPLADGADAPPDASMPEIAEPPEFTASATDAAIAEAPMPSSAFGLDDPLPSIATLSEPVAAEAGESVREVAEVRPMTEAVPLTAIRPTYPRRSRRHGEQGVVKVKLTIDAEGSVAAAEVVSSCGSPDLDRAALAAAKAARFMPAMLDGAVCQSELTLTFDFRLK